MDHICDRCIYKKEPESIRDYYLKTFTMPDLMHWNEDGFKHRYWLCSNSNVSKIDSTNNSIIYRTCQSYNFHGNCTYFKSENAIDIIPAKISLSASATEIKAGETTVLTITVTEPEDEELSYTYTWYKNGRKQFSKKSAELKITSTEEAVDEYYCIVTQSIINNGDGGIKTEKIKSNPVVITVTLSEESSN